MKGQVSSARMVGRVYLVGAGPGDPELITERGARRLREADLVLYDALVHPSILAHAAQAEQVFVGKRAGRPSQRQHEINTRMIDAARAGKCVVRLKGGDPYLFGRGSEEAEALHDAGIPFEVVPGVPSPLAATAYAGISLTHRTLSSSVAYVTATESPEKDRSSHDWSKLATATETLVIFMGLHRVASLMALLIEHGRSTDAPAAVISRASTPDQETLVGTVETLPALLEARPLPTPALIVVGDVVSLRRQLRWYDEGPLFGARVLVTRPEGQGDGLAQRLRDAGAEPILVPAIAIGPPSDPAPLAHLASTLHQYDWVVLTSKNGVDALFASLSAQGRDARAFGGAKVLAIGTATAAALLARGVRVPAEFRGEAAAQALIDELGEGIRAARIALPRAEVARDVLPDTLGAAGASVDVIPVYRNLPRPEDQARIAELLMSDAIDVITLTAPSTLESVLSALRTHGGDATILSRVVCASIGPVTTEAARRAGVRVDVTASPYTADGLFDSLLAHAQRSERPWQDAARRTARVRATFGAAL
jgi:uroporphyrinogen III methyltransferase / synthase